MLNNVSEDDLKKRFQMKIKQGCDLLTSLDSLKSVLGVCKLQRKIKQELSFMNKVLNTNSMKNEHLLSTNLHHFDSLVKCIFSSSDVVSVLETKSYRDECGFPKKLSVDIVCEKGRKWIKVIARNPKALSQILTGCGDYGQKSIADHAVQYSNCAMQNHFMFEPPQIYFFFSSGVTKKLANCLHKINIHVIGSEMHENENDMDEWELNSDDGDKFNLDSGSDNQDDASAVCSISNRFLLESQDIPTINLDVSTMIAYVSALTNGGSNWTFREPVLNQQVEWERLRPVKPVLDDIFFGKNLMCCESACKSFKEIVDIIGGPSEKDRTEKLISNMKVVPDRPYIGLKLGGKIKPRSVLIFGTGYHYKAVTVTANEGFVRAAKHQNADFAVIIHESRALTEIKQENIL